MNARHPFALLLCLLLLITPGCERHLPSTATVTLPPPPMAQAQLIAYAESRGFASDIAERIPGTSAKDLKVAVRKRRNADLLEVSVFSDSPTLSAKAANMGIEVLMDHSRSNNLGPLRQIDPAFPPLR